MHTLQNITETSQVMYKNKKIPKYQNQHNKYGEAEIYQYLTKKSWEENL